MAYQEDDEENKYALSGSTPTQMMGGLTPGTSDQMAPPPPPPVAPKMINADGKQYAFTPGSNGSLTTQAPPNLTGEMQVPHGLPGMPPTISSQEVENYLSGQKNAIRKYGAEDQMALQNSINEKRNSPRSKIVDAGKGFADALMMGVARAGDPGWQGQYEAQQNEMGNQNLATMRGANEANLKQTEAGMSLDKMDAKSPLSKAAQETYAPLFQKLGYPPDAIHKMSATNIENALGLMAQYGGEEVKAKIQQAQFALENKKLDATMANMASEIEDRKQRGSLEEQKMKNEARADYAKMPWWSHITNREALKATEQAAGLGDYTEDVTAYAEKHGITPEQALQVKKARGG